MAEQKTKPTAVSVETFLDQVPDEAVRDDCYALMKLMKKITGSAPSMWGPGIVGFGQYHYTYESGHQGYSCLTGFAPRKANISVYVMPGAAQHPRLLEKLGKHKAGKGCIYIKKLADVDQGVLHDLIKQSVEHLKKTYPAT